VLAPPCARREHPGAPNPQPSTARDKGRDRMCVCVYVCAPVRGRLAATTHTHTHSLKRTVALCVKVCATPEARPGLFRDPSCTMANSIGPSRNSKCGSDSSSCRCGAAHSLRVATAALQPPRCFRHGQPRSGGPVGQVPQGLPRVGARARVPEQPRQVHTRTLTCAPTHDCTRTRTRTRTHDCTTHTHAHTHARTHAHTHTHTCAHTHAHTGTCARANAHAIHAVSPGALLPSGASCH
jgi:hypothetical protein